MRLRHRFPQIAILAFLFLSMSIAVSAEEEPGKTREERRRDTVKYGTETEILELIKVVSSEKNDALDADLLAAAKEAKNPRIFQALLGYLATQKKAGAEDIAIGIMETWDQADRRTLEAAFSYASQLKLAAAVPLLKDIIDSESADFLSQAIRTLGHCGGAEEADFLRTYLERVEPADTVRLDIIYALGELKAPSSVEFLSGLAADDERRAIERMYAIEALGKIGAAEGLDSIVGAFASQDANVRLYAMTALKAFSGDAADERILEGFRDSFYKVRLISADLAGERKLAAAVPFLIYRAERDEVPAVKDASIRALGRISSADATAFLNRIFADKRTGDKAKISIASALLESDANGSIGTIIAAMDEAKKSKQKAELFNGLAKRLASVVSPQLEDLARRFLASPDIIDKHYGLDIVIANGFASQIETIRPLASDKSVALATKARLALEKLESAGKPSGSE